MDVNGLMEQLAGVMGMMPIGPVHDVRLISNLRISNHAKNALRRYKLYTVDDLREVGPNVAFLRNFGKVSLREVEEATGLDLTHWKPGVEYKEIYKGDLQMKRRSTDEGDSVDDVERMRILRLLWLGVGLILMGFSIGIMLLSPWI